MGRAAEQQGDLDQAMAAYRAALERDKGRADAYLRLAILHDKQGKFRESAELYRKALELKPGDPDIFCDMGYSFYLQRRWAEAEMNLRQSLAVNPEHRRAHNNLALLLVRDHRLGDALVEFRRGGSDPVQAHMNLAFALSVDQQWEPAQAEYRARPGDRPLLRARQGPPRRVERPDRQAGTSAGRHPGHPGAARDRRPAGAARALRSGHDPTAIRPGRRPTRSGVPHDRNGLPHFSAAVSDRDTSRQPVRAGRG